jgi:probable HAF family extracellular repeat protein
MKISALHRLVWTALVGHGLLTVSALGRQSEYDVQVFAPVNDQPSMFATGLNEQGVIIGHSGESRYDSVATPLAIVNGRVIEGTKPNDSLNYVLGIGRTELAVGTSSTFPYVWKYGVPRRLRPAGGLPQGNAWDVNTRGVICGDVYRDFTGAQYPVVWTSAGASGKWLRGFGHRRQGSCHAINENNQVTGAIRDVGGFGFVAVRWNQIDRAPKPLGVLPGAMNSEGLCINNHGDVAGRSSFPDLTIQAFVYLDATETMVALGDLGGGYSFANGINDDRQVVGESTVNGELHGFVWQDDTLHDLNDHVRHTNEPFLYISNAVAIDSQGRIAAEVQVNDGQDIVTRIALLTPVK